MLLEFTQEMRDAGLLPMDDAPKDGTSVLILTEEGDLTVANYRKYYWELEVCGSFAGDGFVTPIGWMPIPAALRRFQAPKQP